MRIRELIREDENRKDEGRLEAPLLEGLESEESELTRGISPPFAR